MRNIILITCLLITGHVCFAQLTSNKNITPLDKRVDSLARQSWEKKEYTGLVIAVLDKTALYTYAYGETVKGNNTLPDEKTVFEIGSVTKTFTSLMLALQIVRGKMKADDPVNRYLPDSVKIPAFEGTEITLAMLSNHTSTIPRFDPVMKDKAFVLTDPYRNYTTDKLFSYLRTFKPERKPGTVYDYSNIGAGLLGTLLARFSNTTYAELLRREIVFPLQLEDTKTVTTPEMKTRMAQGYNTSGFPATAWNFDALAGCGAIRSTLYDMIRYIRAQMSTDAAILSKAMQLTHAATFASGGQKVALGWHLINAGNRDIMWHNGQTGGYYSFICFDPTKSKAVIVLSNTSKPNNVGGMLFKHL